MAQIFIPGNATPADVADGKIFSAGANYLATGTAKNVYRGTAQLSSLTTTNFTRSTTSGGSSVAKCAMQIFGDWPFNPSIIHVWAWDAARSCMYTTTYNEQYTTYGSSFVKPFTVARIVDGTSTIVIIDSGSAAVMVGPQSVIIPVEQPSATTIVYNWAILGTIQF